MKSVDDDEPTHPRFSFKIHLWCTYNININN